MDLNDIILDFEIEVPGYGKVEVGDDVFFLRNDVANDISSSGNSLRKGKVIEIYRHPISRNILFRVQADGYRRKPYLSASQLLSPPESGIPYRLNSPPRYTSTYFRQHFLGRLVDDYDD